LKSYLCNPSLKIIATIMKKLLFNLLVFSIICTNSFAQTVERANSIGLLGGISQYNGDLGQGFYGSDQATYAHIGISYSRYITSKADFSTNATFGSLGYIESANKRFRAEQIQWNAHVRLYAFNQDTHKFLPYLHGGIGFQYLQGERVPEGTDFFVPFGAGIRYKINELFNVQLQETFMYTDHDTRDYEARSNNDSYLMHSLSLTMNFGKVKDSDNDGVSDKKDKCPNTPAGVKVDMNGCPLDRDGDGILDADDKCPDVKGTIATKGCPDMDNDGIADADDKCPEVAGTLELQGCPDRDGDGITDAEDKCPDVKGVKELLGCIDTDGDGIIDPSDNCPTVPGTIKMGGCPDKDGDGVADQDDNCPDVAGSISNKGCPEVSEADIKAFNKTVKIIYFETGKDIVRKMYNANLDKLASLLKKNTNYRILIDGNTDNVGDATNNTALSQRRAEAVKAYLVTKGVDAGRVNTIGNGDSKPAAPNTTESNKAKNRRAEFSIVK
jgi:outer membrane protein OmpA-like peptidoglycan-associated protein